MCASCRPQSGCRCYRMRPSLWRSRLRTCRRCDVAGATDLFSPELAAKLCVAGTPEECAEQIKRDILPTGINHVILGLADARLVKVFSGQDIEGVPPITGQLRLVAAR